ncbi:MAG: hypothetical protein R2745_16275 [Vicinamibacterales bacterium]
MTATSTGRTSWPAAPENTANYVFPGLTIGQRRNYPQEFYQNTFSAPRHHLHAVPMT